MQIISAATRRVARLFSIVRRARLAVFAVAAVGLAGCQDKHEWHQKLTVVVDTPSGEVSGSSTIEVVAVFGQLPLSNNEVNYRITGEAAVVEVAPDRFLFALLGRSEERYYRAIRDQLRHVHRGDWLGRIPNMKEVVVLKPDNYPLLVSFRDINDPQRIFEVDPGDLASVFGVGFQLNRITLEITQSPITDGEAGAVLRWLTMPLDEWVKLSPDGLLTLRTTTTDGKTRYIPRLEFRDR